MGAETEGVVKFRLDFVQRPLPPLVHLARLGAWRTLLYRTGLIGRTASRYGGYSYGNVSMRLPATAAEEDAQPFVISGTQTGGLPQVDVRHYAIVTACCPEKNRIRAYGPRPPSAEAMTHGTVYRLEPTAHYVFHAHSPEIWQTAAQQEIPSTDPKVPYGTPAMAAEVARLFAETTRPHKRIFSMGGHEDGVVSFGRTAEEAGTALLTALARGLELQVAGNGDP